MSYWQLYYHLVWTTKSRLPMIDEGRADLITRSIQAICTEAGVLVHAIGVMPDHVHVAVSIPPRIAVAEFVQRLKGTTSHQLNDTGRRPDLGFFAWQPEYGVLSFGERSLERIVAYVNNQREHHAQDGLWPTFELTERPLAANGVKRNQPSPGGTPRA